MRREGRGIADQDGRARDAAGPFGIKVGPEGATLLDALLGAFPPDRLDWVCLAGGGALLLGLAGRVETVAGIPAMVVDDPLRCVVRGAADIVESGAGSASA